MSDELKKCLAALFRQKGKDLMNEREFVYAASMDLHWFSPKEAQILLDASIKSGLLKISHGTLSPTFEISDDMFEIDYKPSKDIIIVEQESEGRDLFMELVDKISSISKLPRKDIVAKINKVRERLPIDIEVAALIVARDLEIEISNNIKIVREEVISR